MDIQINDWIILALLFVLFIENYIHAIRLNRLRDRVNELEELHTDKLEATYPPSVKLTHIVYTGTVEEPKK